MKTSWLLLSAIATGLVAQTARAASVEVGPGDGVEAAMNALKPGDELVLRGGTYTLTDAWHVTIRGTEQAPIVVRAKDGELPKLNRPGIDQNIIDFDDVQYLEVRGIQFSGGSAGLRFITANFVTVQGCEIFGTDDAALTANSGGDYQGLQILNNHIHDTGATGEGMYIGCNSNGCRVHHSVFAGNHIHHTNGPTVTQGDGIEIKEGSYDNVVRDNVIHDTGYPCILTYSTVGNGGPNIIERNVMWNCGDHAIQSAADVIIRNNIILGSAAHGIANQPHQAGTPSNIQILHNTIIQPTGDAIASTGITGSVVIANNAVYSKQGNAIRVAGTLGQVVVAGNVGVGSLSGVSSGLATGDIATDFVAALFSGAPPNDVFPKTGSKLIGAGDSQRVVSDDFNGAARNGVADVGAYAFGAGTNPGWTIAAAFKNATPVPDGGSGGAGGSTGTGGSMGTGGSAGSTVPAAGGGPAAAPAAEEASGCGCRTAPGGGSRAAWIAAFAFGAIAVRRRRANVHVRCYGSERPV
jgi:MYXO-CTERM domain-containing protein